MLKNSDNSFNHVFKSTQDWLDFDREHLWHPYTSMADPLPCYPVVATQGSMIELADGRQLIDGMSSWWCAIHGYNHPQLLRALQAQAKQMPHVMFGGIAHQAASELGAKLLQILPDQFQHIFLADSGSIAIEVALKMALQYWQSIGQPAKQQILTVKGGYHGDPFTCMSVGDPQNGNHPLFRGVISPQHYADRPNISYEQDWQAHDIDSVKRLLETKSSEIAAVIIEPIVQGAVSMHFYHPDYLRALRDLCDEHSVLLIFDEIATGFGRTGKMWAMEHAGICPDIVSVGKALTGGVMTLAATICTSTVANGISGGEVPQLMHGPTFMANPLACAVACASIDVLLDSGPEASYVDGWQQSVIAIEQSLRTLKQIESHHSVAEVRILGAIGVVHMNEAVDVAIVQAALVAKGVWVRPFGHLIYLMPPYILTELEVLKLCSAVIETIQELN